MIVGPQIQRRTRAKAEDGSYQELIRKLTKYSTCLSVSRESSHFQQKKKKLEYTERHIFKKSIISYLISSN